LEYLRLAGGSFNLTDKEMEVLSLFVNQHLKENRKNVFTPADKQEIAKELGLDDFNRLNVFIKKLKDKRAIIKQVEGYHIHTILIPDSEGISFIWNTEDN